MLTIENTNKMVGQFILDFKGNKWIITDIKAVGKINTQTKFGWNEYQIDITRSVNYRKLEVYLKRDPYMKLGAPLEVRYYELYFKRGSDRSSEYITFNAIKDMELLKASIYKMCLSM